MSGKWNIHAIITRRYKCLLHAKFGNKPYPDDINVYYIVINIFLLISMENNRAIYPCICMLYVYCTSSNMNIWSSSIFHYIMLYL